MSDNIEYKIIETEILKILTLNCDKYISQYEIYSKLLDKFNIVDPHLKTILKDRLLIILRVLTNYEHILFKINNGVYYVCFQLNKKENDIPDLPTNDKPNDFDKIESCINDTDISVIRFIIDKNLEEYFGMLDKDKNNILHSLIKDNDIIRVEKILDDTDTLFLMEENVFRKTPIDLINSSEMAAFFIKRLFDEISNKSYEISNLNKKNDELILKIDGIVTSIQILCIIVTILSICNFF